MKMRKNILLALVSTLLALVFAEIILSSFFTKNRGDYLSRPNIDVKFSPEPGIMPGVQGVTRFTTNSVGIRGEEFPDKPVKSLLAIGGSTTECLYLDTEVAWPKVLQNNLNQNTKEAYWVGNGGKSGTSSAHHILQVDHVLKSEHFKGIDAIVLMIGVNDLLLYLADSALYLNPDPARLKEMVFWQGGQKKGSLIKNTAIYQLTTSTWRKYKPGKTKQQTRQQDNAGKIYERWRAYRQNSPEIIDTLPDLSQALLTYENNLNAIITKANTAKIKLFFLTQPVLWNETLSDEEAQLLWMGGKGAYQDQCCSSYYSPKALEQGMNLFNQRLMEVANRKGIPYLDLGSLLEKDTSTFYDDCHFNEPGSRKVAKAVSQFLQEQL